MIWKRLEHFTPLEKWGEPNKMSGLLLLLMDAIADEMGHHVIVHCGYELGGHSKNGQHDDGTAADFHFKEAGPYFNQICELERILEDLQVADRVGLGIYPDWNNPGFHLDVRGARARWGRVGNTYVTYAHAKDYAESKMHRE